MSEKYSYQEKKKIFLHLLDGMTECPVTHSKWTDNQFRKELKLAISKGFPINFSPIGNSYGTLLAESLVLNQNCAYILLDAGADVNVLDENGNNILILAIIKGVKAKLIVDILTKTQDINHCNAWNSNAFNYLAEEYIQLSYYIKNCKDYSATIKYIKYQKDLLGLIPPFLMAGAKPYTVSRWTLKKTDSCAAERKAIVDLKNTIDEFYNCRNELIRTPNNRSCAEYTYEL